MKQTPSLSTSTLKGGGADLSRRRGKQRGVLIQTKTSWIGQYWEPVRLPNGKRHWRRRKRALCPANRTRTEAQRIFDEAILDQLETRSRYPEMQATLREFWQKFEPTLKYYKRKGRELYYYVVEKLVLPGRGDHQMREIGLTEVQGLVDYWYAKDLAPSTLLKIRHAVSKLFRYAKQIKWYSGDLPTVGLMLPEMEAKERVALTKEQFGSLLRGLPSPAREMVFTLGLLGLRISELVGLKWKRLNLTGEARLVDGESIPAMTAAVREQLRIFPA